MIFQSKAIAALQASFDEAQATLATNAAALSEMQAELASATSINANLSASVDALTAEAALNAAALAHAEAAIITAELAAAAAEKSVEAQVLERLASAGVDPIKRDPVAKEGGNGTSLSLTEFNALTPSQKSEFSIKGGRIA